MLRTVHLYGLARKKFGPSVQIDVSSVGEAVRALSTLFKGFRSFVTERHFRVVFGTRKCGLHLGEEQIQLSLPAGDIHVIPAIAGAKSGGIGKIIAGIILLSVSFFVPFSTPLLGGALFGLTAGNAAVMGLGLIATGVSQMMTKQQTTDEKKDESFMLEGALNNTEQGGPVPLIYGRTIVGSTLISGGITTRNMVRSA